MAASGGLGAGLCAAGVLGDPPGLSPPPPGIPPRHSRPFPVIPGVFFLSFRRKPESLFLLRPRHRKGARSARIIHWIPAPVQARGRLCAGMTGIFFPRLLDGSRFDGALPFAAVFVLPSAFARNPNPLAAATP
ncbi:MAG: hypothetical protein OXU61_08965 [Gammaproteobacteria bacterium]|nr:hypothetical protein [Gammaproteobacteria bacterium]